MSEIGGTIGAPKSRAPQTRGNDLDEVTRIHFKLGGQTSPLFSNWSGDRVTAVYYKRDKAVFEQTAPGALALALLSVWDDEFGGVIEYEDVELTADWPVNFGKAKRLETRARKLLKQAP